MVVETELGAKVYADSERALADNAKSVHFHDWLMNIEFNASRNFYFELIIELIQITHLCSESDPTRWWMS